jgi:hypothetical protein
VPDALLLYRFAEAVGVIGFVDHDGVRAQLTEQRVGDFTVARLSCGQAEPDRQAFRVDDGVDLGCESAS